MLNSTSLIGIFNQIIQSYTTRPYELTQAYLIRLLNHSSLNLMDQYTLIRVHCRSSEERLLPQLNLKQNFFMTRKNYGPKSRIERRSNIDTKLGALCMVHLSSLILFLLSVFSFFFFFPLITLHYCHNVLLSTKI